MHKTHCISKRNTHTLYIQRQLAAQKYVKKSGNLILSRYKIVQATFRHYIKTNFSSILCSIYGTNA